MARKPSKTWFYETTLPDTRNDLTKYSLKKKDHTVAGHTYLSLHKIYISMEDPTEYDFAMAVFEDFSVWENLCNLSWFKQHHLQMKKELVLKLKARTVKGMINDLNEGKASYNAQKYLADAGYLEENEKGKRGRPSNEELDGALKQAALDKADTKDDAARIGLIN
tara:strand:+ start:466 stop:960 length:495 start_codon:yes stop_codon:yes gene_type:complete